MNDAAQEEAPSSSEEAAKGTAASRPPKALTLRALLIGLILSLVFAALVPWNDWIVGNTTLYNNYMPPTVTLVLLALGLLINPLLGRFRLRLGELGVIVIMLLGIGGVVSSGLARYFSTSVTMPAKYASDKATYLRLYTYLDQAAQEQAERDHRQAQIAEFRRLDRDGDARLQAAELPRGAPSDSLDEAAWLAWRAETHPAPDQGWVLSPSLFLGIPEHGPIDSNDPEFFYVVDQHYEGISGWADNPKVGHRSRVTWIDAEGVRHERQPVFGGQLRDQYEPGSYLDLEDPQSGAAIRGLRPGEVGAVDQGRRYVSEGESLQILAQRFYDDPQAADLLGRSNGMRGQDPNEVIPAGHELVVPALVKVEAVESGGIPWDRWIAVAFAWAPLLIGAFIAMIALAGIVHRQWMHNERLPYPIAQVTLSLMQEPSAGARFAAIFKTPAFWVGVATSGLVLLLYGLSEYQILPIDVKLEGRFDERELKGPPWDKAYQPRFMYAPKIFFSIAALAFFLAVDVSFSLWFSFALLNVVFLVFATQGMPINKNHVSQASLGGYAVMCGLLIWMGRQYYWRLLKAAVVGHKDEQIRVAVPYIWALLIGMGVMLAFFLLHGAPLFAALLYILIFLGIMLVLARMVAEAGIPFLQTPFGTWINAVQFSVIGFGMPVAALMPLTYIGVSLMADTREAMLPYAVQAGYIGDKAGVPPRRGRLLFLGIAIVAAIIAVGSMLVGSYLLTDRHDDGWPRLLVNEAMTPLVKGLGQIQTGEGALALEASTQRTWLAYGIGAIITLILGLGRLRFAWWPLHPIGFLICTSYPGWRIWFAVFLGWLGKFLVMRYGGSGLFERLKPYAVGLIAGEVLIGGTFIFIRLFGGEAYKTINVLPG